MARVLPPLPTPGHVQARAPRTTTDAPHVAAGAPRSAAIPDLGAVLADALDLAGSVRIAQAVHAKSRDSGLLADPGAVDRARTAVQRRIAEVEAYIARFDQAALGARGVLSAARLDEVLSGATEAQSAVASRALFAPLGALTASYLAQVRAAMREVRDEIAPMLQDAGPRLARLEHIDSVLGAASSARRERLLERLLAAIEASFAEVIATRDDARSAATACAALVTATLEHERIRIEALLRAATEERAS